MALLYHKGYFQALRVMRRSHEYEEEVVSLAAQVLRKSKPIDLDQAKEYQMGSQCSESTRDVWRDNE
jgi:hypothetical protein